MKNVTFSQFLESISKTMPSLNVPPLEHALSLPRPEGMLVELGVYTGASISKMAKANPSDTIYGFDSFEGLPENWNRPDMTFDKGAFSLNKKLPDVPPNVELIAGWFDQTLPAFAQKHLDDAIGFLHVDCDIYSSTKCAFQHLGPLLQKGTIIVFDELLNYPTYEIHEVKAFYEFLIETDYEVEWIGKLGRVELNPTKDNGYYDQPVACRLV